jgi:outer membrane lipoprotein SlyB
MAMRKITRAACAAALAAMLGGCAYNMGPGDYHAVEARGEQSVRFGVVDSVKPVRIQPYNTGVGSTSGAFIGGIAGSNVGGGNGQIVGAIGGALIGSILGYNIEKSANELPGVEVTVLLDSGKYIAVVQEATEPFKPGDRVRILGGHNSTRVTH